jgi:hypothetical protein
MKASGVAHAGALEPPCEQQHVVFVVLDDHDRGQRVGGFHASALTGPGATGCAAGHS